MARYQPKTLAKTLTYIVYSAPSEHGLFWAPDGTMPWKDLYWVLQEDPSLRFVRESHIREILYLGIALPFALDGSLMRLRSGYSVPECPIVGDPPERLFFSFPARQLPIIRDHGIRSTRRCYVALTADKDLAMRMARRRAKEPITVEVLARKAVEAGVQIRQSGAELFLVDFVAVEYLLLPKLRDDVLAGISADSRGARGAKEKTVGKGAQDPAPGSFKMDAVEFERIYGRKEGTGKPGGRSGGSGNWKEHARKERRKRIP